MADGDPGSERRHGPQVNLVRGQIGGSVVQARDVEELHVHLPVPERVPSPRQLPPAPTPFFNRCAEVQRVDMLTTSRELPGVAPVVILTGGHGVEKSATSRHWAHANSDRFPNGQLYVDYSELRHGGGGGGGVAVADVVGRLLRALGVDDSVIPVTLVDRVALFRSRLAGRRVLILLDDARYAAEVTPLIPATARCCVLVTTRAPMRELVVDGAHVVRLSPLDDRSAELLVTAMVGSDRVARELDAVRQLRALCAGLPVAPPAPLSDR